MDRLILTDAQSARMEPHCVGKPGDPGRSGKNNRLFVEAVLGIVRTGSPWRDLPPSFGNWNSVFTRFRDWLGKGGRLSAAVQRRLGGSRHGIRYSRRHHRQGPPARTGRKRGTSRQAIGRSKGGLTTKILALTDALGNLVRFVLLPGQRFDTVGVPPLIDGLAFGALIGDTAFDSNEIIADLNERGAKVVIAQQPRRVSPLDIDTEMYKWRHLIENFFCKLKEFKRIALRADKTDQSFAAMIYLAAAVINSR